MVSTNIYTTILSVLFPAMSIVNNNPETVSTDFDTSDRLYFDPLTPEDVDAILETESLLAVFPPINN